MVITESQIRRIMPNATSQNIAEFVRAFNGYSEMFGINSKLRICGFLSQIAVESGELRYTEENLNYSADGLMKVFPKYFTPELARAYARQPQRIANRVYANRMGNGDEESGDGYRYKGRGLLQVTGKNNYLAYAKSEFCNGDLMSHPEWLAQYPGALKSAMYYWYSHNLNKYADAEDINGLSKAVNGGTNGLASRMYYWRKAKRILCV